MNVSENCCCVSVSSETKRISWRNLDDSCIQLPSYHRGLRCWEVLPSQSRETRHFVSGFSILWRGSFHEHESNEDSSKNNATRTSRSGFASERLQSSCPWSFCRYGNKCLWGVLCSGARSAHTEILRFFIYMFSAEPHSGMWKQESVSVLQISLPASCSPPCDVRREQTQSRSKVPLMRSSLQYSSHLFLLLQIGENGQVQIGFHTFVIGCESTLTLQNWRWCCYGNCWCCSHLWGALQVKCLIKNFWCMPKLPLWSTYSYVFGAGDNMKGVV